jgi:Holliday junction DNA helicase RuvA
MIVQLTGTLMESLPTHAVLDVGGVGYELGISSNTAAALPALGEPGVTLLTRLIVREDAMELYGFATREERALFDRLISISRVGPKLALAVLSTFTPAALAAVVNAQDVARMSQVPGVGKKSAQRLLVELEGVFAKDSELRGLVGLPVEELGPVGGAAALPDAIAEASDALLSMGFTSQEAELALEGAQDAGATTTEKALAFALRRLGKGA